MVDKKIEQRIQTAISNATPDVLDQIYASCDEQKGTEKVINMNDTTKKKSKWRGTLIAAALVLVVLGGLSYNFWSLNKVNAKVILDVNPSIYINVNAKEKVLSVEPGNEDGRKIIGNMDLRNTNLDVAVNALIGSMLQNGYLTDLHNAILVSVEDDDAAKGAELQSKLTNIIDKMLKNSQFESVVVAQTVTANQSILDIANRYNISEGKAALINELVKQDNKLTVEELAPLSVHEITLIMESKGIDPKEVTKTGSASEKAYIGKENAKKIAFSHANVDSSKVASVDVEFDTEDGIMVYEIEFNIGTIEYEYDIHAVSGEIIKYSKDIEDDDNDYDDVKSATYIGKEKAKAAAFAHSSVNENEVSNFKIDFDYDDKKAVYEIEFETKDAEYEYVIDAITGNVLESERESKKSTASNKQSASNQASGEYIGKSKALSVALEHAGVNKSAVKEYEVELDRDDNKAVYDIEFKTSEAEYDYEVDAYSGKVLKFESENKGSKNTSKSNVTPKPNISQDYISKTKAKEIAFKHASVDEAKVKGLEIELDKDDGRAIYEIDFNVGNTEYDYEVDAVTGDILKSEADIDD